MTHTQFVLSLPCRTPKTIKSMKLAEKVKPVSYTHLDVYKRQVFDKDQYQHLGIITTPVPILKTTQEKIKEIRQQLYLPDFKDLIVVDFSDVAQRCNIYDEYIEKANQTPGDDFTYYGIAIYGTKKLVNKLTGSLPLLRSVSYTHLDVYKRQT